MRMFRKDEGFTLVELMVVVLIIGILVAIAIPVFNAASGNARLKTCQSNQRTIEGAVQQYLAGNPTLSWTADIIDGTDVLTAGSTYIKTAPRCPSSNGYYSVNGSGTVDGDEGAATFYDDTLPHHVHF